MGPFCVLDSVCVGRAKHILCAAGSKDGKELSWEQKEMVENLLPRGTEWIFLEGHILVLWVAP